MYLSLLIVDGGGNPDRPRPGRMWVSNPYRVHQRLCMAFPDVPQAARSEERSILFRIEAENPAWPRVLVQSAEPPEWEKAFRNAMFLLEETPKVKQFDPVFNAGERFRFLLRANPTAKTALPKSDGTKPNNKRRFGLKGEEEQLAWFQRKAADNGFVAVDIQAIAARPRVSRKSRMLFKEPQIHLSVDFTGVLEVRDPPKLRDAVIRGIGSAKGYGFGLLSLARISP